MDDDLKEPVAPGMTESEVATLDRVCEISGQLVATASRIMEIFQKIEWSPQEQELIQARWTQINEAWDAGDHARVRELCRQKMEWDTGRR